MSLSQLLIVLSLTADGMISAAFVNTGDPESCRLRQSMVVGLLQGSGVQVVDHACVTSERRFSPYRHSASSQQGRRVWLIDLKIRPVWLEPVADRQACQGRRDALMRRGTLSEAAVCAVTEQRELGLLERLWGDLRRWLAGSGSGR